MKRSSHSRRGLQDSGPAAPLQPEKAGWIRKFCGRGIFRELWRSRYMMLRGDHLYISEKEVKEERKAQEVFDLADYERSEELRKAKSRSKKNHSRFTLLRCRRPANTVPNLVFLAVSPEEKESWVHALNVAIVKAKNRVLDEVTVEEDGVLVHPTRDRVKIPHSRRLPTRGHLLAVASSSSHGTLTLDLVAEEDGLSPEVDSQESWENTFQVGVQDGPGGLGGVGGRQRASTDVSKLRAAPKETKVKTGSLPRGSERSWGKQAHLEVSKTSKAPQAQVLQAQSRTPQPGKRFNMQGRSRCASMDEVLSCRPAMIRSALRRCPAEAGAPGGGASGPPVGPLQSLIAQRMQRAQELLEEMRLQELQKTKAEREQGGGSPYLTGIDSPRLHHLRGSDSPHSRSSGSPRSRSSDSPRLRGRESPRSRAKRSRSKASDSPRSRGSNSPRLKGSPQPTTPPPSRTCEAAAPPPSRTCEAAAPPPSRTCEAAAPPLSRTSEPAPPPPTLGESRPASSIDGDNAPPEELREWCPSEGGGGSPQVGGSPQGTQMDSPGLGGSRESTCPDSSSPTGSFNSSLPKTPDKPRQSPPPPEEDEEVERRRAEAERLLEEAVSSWKEAQEVLQEVKELQSQTLRRQRRRTYEKMAAAAAADEDTPTSPTSPEDEEESGTP